MNPKNNNGATALVKAFETAGIAKIFTLSGMTLFLIPKLI